MHQLQLELMIVKSLFSLNLTVSNNAREGIYFHSFRVLVFRIGRCLSILKSTMICWDAFDLFKSRAITCAWEIMVNLFLKI